MTDRKPYRLNVIGPFYVEDSCCALCGVPWDNAPALFEYNDEQCYVKLQPRTADELDQMLLVMSSQELGCVRYRGDQPDILQRLTDLGEASSCDRITDAPPAAVRDEVTFHAAPLIMTKPIIEALAARTIVLTELPNGRWRIRHASGWSMADQIQRWLTADSSITDVRWTNAAERAVSFAGPKKPF